MGRWTHPQCPDCWLKERGNTAPMMMHNAPQETCCWCGQSTREGIYVRHDPALLRCDGEHGRGVLVPG